MKNFTLSTDWIRFKFFAIQSFGVCTMVSVSVQSLYITKAICQDCTSVNTIQHTQVNVIVLFAVIQWVTVCTWSYCCMLRIWTCDLQVQSNERVCDFPLLTHTWNQECMEPKAAQTSRSIMTFIVINKTEKSFTDSGVWAGTCSGGWAHRAAGQVLLRVQVRLNSVQGRRLISSLRDRSSAGQKLLFTSTTGNTQAKTLLFHNLREIFTQFTKLKQER